MDGGGGMIDNLPTNFTYLNQNGIWPAFTCFGLERLEDGSVQLASMPLLLDEWPLVDTSDDSTSAAAGITAAADGTLFYSRPNQHLVMKMNGCREHGQLKVCLGEQGNRPTQFHSPRGVLLHPTRPALLVADYGNNRIQLFDPHSLQLLDIWDGIKKPAALTADKDGNVYIIEADHRVQKFNFRGREKPTFWQQVKAAGTVRRPVAVAIHPQQNATRIFVINTKKVQGIKGPNLVVLDDKGRLVSGPFHLKDIGKPQALSVSGQKVYVGSNHLHVYRHNSDSTELDYVGKAFGFEGLVAALTIAPDGMIWLLPANASSPLRLAPGQAHLTRGVLLGGPFTPEAYPVHWRRLQAFRSDHNSDARLQLFTFTSNDKEPKEKPQTSTDQFASGTWKSLPQDIQNALVPGQTIEQGEQDVPEENMLPAQKLWIGAVFSGNGRSTPILEQIRLSYGENAYSQHLPDIFRKERAQRETLEGLLALFESTFDGIENEIAHLGRYFNPHTIPAAWLPWLASWVAVDLDEKWSEAQQREVVALALKRSEQRGTAVGLRQALQEAGILAHIEEPHLHASWWTLADNGQENGVRLGVDTRLAPAEADTAVIGRTATLDRAHLITTDERGAPLFTQTAHQFTVQLYRGQAEQPGILEWVKAIVDTEKPAHTAYHLCLIEPHMRIGFQARLGIDTIVACSDSEVEWSQQSSDNTRLKGKAPGFIGVNSRVGETTKLG